MNGLKRFRRVFSSSSFLKSEVIQKRQRSFDVAIVCGGHNGLTAAAYLGHHGLKVLVTEKRAKLGGAAVTEEIIPGFHFSRCSYVLSLLLPSVREELQLDQHGLKLYGRDPVSFTQLDDGKGFLLLGKGGRKNGAEVAKFAAADAKALEAYEAELVGHAVALEQLMELSPAELTDLVRGGLAKAVVSRKEETRRVWRAAKAVAAADLAALSELMTAPIAKTLNAAFEGEALKATLATDAMIGAMVGPYTPGSGYVLLHHIMGNAGSGADHRGSWFYPRGGMGAVSAALADAARTAGATLEVNNGATKILLNKGRACGLRLEDGQEVKAKVILSNATPAITLLDLLSEEDDALGQKMRKKIKSINYTSPVTKINLAVNKVIISTQIIIINLLTNYK